MLWQVDCQAILTLDNVECYDAEVFTSVMPTPPKYLTHKATHLDTP